MLSVFLVILERMVASHQYIKYKHSNILWAFIPLLDPRPCLVKTTFSDAGGFAHTADSEMTVNPAPTPYNHLYQMVPYESGR